MGCCLKEFYDDVMDVCPTGQLVRWILCGVWLVTGLVCFITGVSISSECWSPNDFIMARRLLEDIGAGRVLLDKEPKDCDWMTDYKAAFAVMVTGCVLLGSFIIFLMGYLCYKRSCRYRY